MKIQFELVGGHPLLDLINTERISNGAPVDMLGSAAHLAAWLRNVGLASSNQAIATHNDASLKKVHHFRTQIREIVRTIVTDGTVPSHALVMVNENLSLRKGVSKVKAVDGELIQRFIYDFDEPNSIVGCLADVAAHFLTTTDLRYVKQCEHDDCIRYFLDTSRNHSRRWCTMEGCGNRVKARIHYKKRRAKQ